MGVRGVHLKPTNSLFQSLCTKERNSKYTSQKNLMLKSLPAEGIEPAVKVVT